MLSADGEKLNISAPMKRAAFLFALSCLCIPAFGQDKGPFTISINRPCKVGDKFALSSLAHINTTRSSTVNGSAAGANVEMAPLLLEGDMEIQAVTPKESQAWKYRVQVTKCVAGEKAGAKEYLPAGTEITMELDKARSPLLKVNGKPVAEPLLSLLKVALPSPASEDARADDLMFGHNDKKAEEDEWQPDVALVTTAFKKLGFTGEASAMKSRARLTEITDWDDVPCILVKGDVTIKPCSVPEVPADAAKKEGRMSFNSEYYLPLDVSLPMVREKRVTSTSATYTPQGGTSTVSVEKMTSVARTLLKK